MKIPALLERSELGRSIWTFRREFVWVGVFSFFSNLLMLAPTLYMLQVFDRVMLSQNEFTLISLTLIVILFFAVMGFAEWVRSRLLVRAGVRFDEFLNSRVFKSSFDANLNLMASNPVQSFSDLTNLRQFLTGNGIFALFDTPWTPIYMAVLFMIHPWLGFTSVIFAGILGFLAWYSHKLTAAVSVQANDAVVKSNSYLQGKLVHVETVVSLGMLANLRRHWLMLYSDQLDKSLDAQHLQYQVQAFVKFVQYTQQSLVLALGALLAIRGDISAGSMVASNALVSNALRPIGTLVSTWRQFADAQASYLRLEKLMKEHPERGAVHASDVIYGQVTLHDVVATAPGRTRPILKGLSVSFNAGEVVAIVGPSGAGKSTLARCIIGIWPDVQGQTLLDGHDINAWSRDDLGPHLGYLPQDIELFEGTIAENIGRFSDLKSEWVIDAAQRTGIHDMILRFPKGYDTPMGVAGGLLSGGQRQRVGLARAIYGNPALVVLDEPNANLDDAGEAALIRTVQDLRQQGKTVFMVVHQRNLLSVADRVLVLNDGVITQFGQLAAQPPAVTTSSEPLAQTRTA